MATTKLSTKEFRNILREGIARIAEEHGWSIDKNSGRGYAFQYWIADVIVNTEPGFDTKIHATKLVTLSRTLLPRWLGRLGLLLTADLDRALVAALSINTVSYREEGCRGERARLAALHGAGGPAALLADLGLSAGGG